MFGFSFLFFVLLSLSACLLACARERAGKNRDGRLGDLVVDLGAGRALLCRQALLEGEESLTHLPRHVHTPQLTMRHLHPPLSPSSSSKVFVYPRRTWGHFKGRIPGPPQHWFWGIAHRSKNALVVYDNDRKWAEEVCSGCSAIPTQPPTFITPTILFVRLS